MKLFSEKKPGSISFILRHNEAAFRPQIVPVGEDQIPHLEMTREVTNYRKKLMECFPI